MGRTCSTYGRDEKYTQTCSGVSSKRRDYLSDLGVGGIILKRILNE